MSTAKNIILHNHNVEERAVKVLLGLLAVSLASYLFLIGSITFSVINRKSMEGQAKAAATHTNTLELSYLKAQESIDLSFAYTAGFVDVPKEAFGTPTTTVALDERIR